MSEPAGAPLSDQPVADAFLRRQMVVTSITGLVALLALGGASLVVSLTDGGSRGLSLAAVAVAGVVLAGALITVVVHAVRLAGFAFRKEVQ